MVNKVNAFQTNDTSNLAKKTRTQKLVKLKKELLFLIITTKEFNDLTTENLPTRLKHANLATKVDINDLVEKTDFDAKLKKFK